MRDYIPLLIKSSSDAINTYKLPSLGYEITDQHLLRGFITPKKSNMFILYEFIYCDQTNDHFDGSVLACGHGYHSYCLQKCQFKCLICLDYLQNEIKKNVDALLTNMMKDSVENDTIDENIEDEGKDNLNDAKAAIDDLIMDNSFEFAKKSFLEL